MVKGLCKLPQHPKRFNPKSDRDLWSVLKAEAALRDVEVVKIESRLNDDDFSVFNGTFPLAWVRGNQAADVLAGEAAADAQVPSACAEAVRWVDSLAHLVRARLIATLDDAINKDSLK